MRGKLLAPGLAAVLIATGLSVIGGSPAAATPRHGCVYPRVCLYLHRADWLDRKPTAAYQNVTFSYQVLGPRSRHAYAAFNSRNEDVAWLRDADGNSACVGSNETWFAHSAEPPLRITSIQIDGPSDCL